MPNYLGNTASESQRLRVNYIDAQQTHSTLRSVVSLDTEISRRNASTGQLYDVMELCALLMDNISLVFHDNLRFLDSFVAFKMAL